MQDKVIQEALKNWRPMIRPFKKPNKVKAIIQILNSFLPFIGLLVLMYFSLEWSYMITLGLGLLSALFLVRIFIIQHDCGHQSFLGSRRWNNVIGFISSFFSTVPYHYWSRTHSEHHAHNGQYEHRGIGDTNFKTTDEYQMLSKWNKRKYRAYRSLFVQFIVAPIFYFTVMLRIPLKRLKGWKKIRWSFFMNNSLVLIVYLLLGLIIGWKKLLLVHVPVMLIFSFIAFWFFYIQHQHEDNYKAPQKDWDHLMASIKGSTFYKLPKIFQWFTGNIGLHHLHHLDSKIPNYHLQACLNAHPELNEYANILNFRQSLKCVNHALWDEREQRMISFREYNRKIREDTNS